jgi:hypothetical protein
LANRIDLHPGQILFRICTTSDKKYGCTIVYGKLITPKWPESDNNILAQSPVAIDANLSAEFKSTSTIPSHDFKSLEPHVEHCEDGFGSPSLGSVTSLTASIFRTESFSCHNMTRYDKMNQLFDMKRHYLIKLEIAITTWTYVEIGWPFYKKKMACLNFETISINK